MSRISVLWALRPEGGPGVGSEALDSCSAVPCSSGDTWLAPLPCRQAGHAIRVTEAMAVFPALLVEGFQKPVRTRRVNWKEFSAHLELRPIEPHRVRDGANATRRVISPSARQVCSTSRYRNQHESRFDESPSAPSTAREQRMQAFKFLMQSWKGALSLTTTGTEVDFRPSGLQLQSFAAAPHGHLLHVVRLRRAVFGGDFLGRLLESNR